MISIGVFGIDGMLGSAVHRAIERRGHKSWDFAMDITNLSGVLPPVKVDAIINCAGLVKGRDGYRDSDFIKVNGYGPHHLAEVCDKSNTCLIHVSTDCVFQGPGPHSETSLPDAGDIYALSKRAGEVTRAPHLTVRTSFVGFGQRGLIADLQRAAKTGEPVRASHNVRWSGHTVDTVADVLVTLAERSDVTGLLHIPGLFTTRHALVHMLCELLLLDVTVIDNADFWVDRRLVSDRWASLELPELPAFGVQLERMLRP